MLKPWAKNEVGGLTFSGKVEDREGETEKGRWCVWGEESKEERRRLREWNGRRLAVNTLNKSLSEKQASSLSLGGA